MHREADLLLLTGLVSRTMHATMMLFSYKHVIEGQGSIITKKNTTEHESCTV